MRAACRRGEPRLLAYWNPSIGYGPAGIGDLPVDQGPAALHLEGFSRPVQAATATTGAAATTATGWPRSSTAACIFTTMLSRLPVDADLQPIGAGRPAQRLLCPQAAP